MATLLVVVGVSAWFAGRRALAFRHLTEARRQIAARDFAAATAELEAAGRLRPDDPEAAFLRARVHRRQGRLDRFRTDLERARNLGYDAEAVERENWLALAQTGRIREAEPHRDEMLVDPGDDAAEICEAFVTGYFVTYRFDRALEIIRAWEADFPNDPQPHFFLGAHAEFQARDAEAAQEFARALELAPHRRDVRLRLAGSLVRLQRYDEAETHYRELLEDKADDPEVLHGWGTLRKRQGRRDEAEVALEAALRRDPRRFDTRLELARLAAESGDHAGATHRLESLIAERPRDPGARYALASAYAEAGRSEDAKPHFEFAAEASRMLAKTGRLSRQLAADPSNVDLRYEIGRILLEYGSEAEGSIWLRSVLDVRPDHAPARRALAEHAGRAAGVSPR